MNDVIFLWFKCNHHFLNFKATWYAILRKEKKIIEFFVKVVWVWMSNLYTVPIFEVFVIRFNPLSVCLTHLKSSFIAQNCDIAQPYKLLLSWHIIHILSFGFLWYTDYSFSLWHNITARGEKNIVLIL